MSNPERLEPARLVADAVTDAVTETASLTAVAGALSSPTAIVRPAVVARSDLTMELKGIS